MKQNIFLMNNIILTEFNKTVNDMQGKISSVKFRKSYFIKHNKTYLWDWFEEQKHHFNAYSNREILLILNKGLTEPPKCIVCGKNAKVQTYSSNITFDYCSNICSKQSTKRAKKISETKLSYTKEQKTLIENKRIKTNIEKYGVEYQSQRPEIKNIVGNKLTNRYLESEIIEKLNDKNWLYSEYILNNRTSVDIADELKVYYGTVIEYCKKYGFDIRKFSQDSLPQRQIYDFIKSFYNGEVIYNDWSVLKDKELDIYLPNINLAIEHNGLFYHSFTNKNKKSISKHLEKTNICSALGITLFHIRGDYWQFKKEIIKSILKNKLKCSEQSLYARECELKVVSTKDSTKFLTENHIQGVCGSNIKLGLFYQNELVSHMTFGKPRFNKNYQWELLRFCNKLNYNVTGGFSKLLLNFRRNNKGNIISYCDRSISNGNVYLKNGFKQLIETNKITPGYYWTNNQKVFTREYFQKYKLKKLFKQGKLKFYDENLSEMDNMLMNNYRLIFDCGQISFGLE